MTGLSWNWIAVMVLIPLPAGLLVALPFWRARQMILGNLAGGAVVLLIALVLILREHAELDRITQSCLASGITCWPDPSAFMRFAIFASIGMLEVFAIFLISIRVDDRAARRRYSPEWR
jgi:hypothetical protein